MRDGKKKYTHLEKGKKFFS